MRPISWSGDAGMNMKSSGMGLDCSCGSHFTQILFVLSSELPRVMNIIGKMHDFDFVAFIQRQP